MQTVWLLPLVLLFSLVQAETGYFFHLSDVHLDLEYTPGTDPMFRCINKTVPSNNTAGTFGNPICDTPLPAYQAALDAMKALNPNPDFIFYTGDSVPHWLQYWSVQQYTEEMVVSGVSSVITLLRSNFPNTPIFPALGNHDNFLSDQLPQPPKSDRWLSFMAQVWSRLLPEDALKTVAYGGYYTVSISPKLRLIHFNSIYCDTSNLYAVLNQTDHANQFTWFATTLANAKKAGERVYIIGHITPTDYFNFCLQNYLDLASQYSDIIAGHFYGDRHTDEFRSRQDQSKAVGMMYVMSSIVPETWYNPSFRVFQYNKENGTLIDYLQYYTVLGDGRTPLKYTLEYSAKNAYKLPDMSPSSWLESWKLMHTDDTLWNNFKTFYTTSYPWTCDEYCKAQMLARIGMAPSGEKIWARPTPLVGPPLEILNAGYNQQLLSQWKGPYQQAFMERVCVGFIWLYGPFALPIIAEEEVPKQVCYALKLCA